MIASMTIITRNSVSKAAWKRNIESILGEQATAMLEIKAIIASDLTPGQNYYDDLVLLATNSIEAFVRCCLDPRAKVIVASRTLNLEHIHLMADIPEGSDILIINDALEYCEEIRNELVACGFTNYNYYCLGEPKTGQRRFEYGVTTGEGFLVPEVPNIIDLGLRQVTMNTISEILFHFHEQLRLDGHIFNRYVSNYIHSSISLYQQIKNNESLQKLLISIIQESENGVVVFDSDYQVIVSNNAAAEILGEISSDKIRDLIPRHWDSETKSEFFIYDLERPVYLSLVPLMGAEVNVYMGTFTDLYNVQRINKNYSRSQPKSTLAAKHTFEDFISKSEEMGNLVKKAQLYASIDEPILIMGESGVGKELLAQSIHNASARASGPFIAVNCGSFSDTLLESELFGYEEGAFTGASKKGKRGLFEAANKGTLFLDEIGDAPASIQQKLLRVLQEGEVYRISSVRPINVDVRIIAATNKKLSDEVRAERFRLDFFYRINTFTLYIPPLRERPVDVEYLFNVLLSTQLQQYKLPWPSQLIGPEVYSLLKSYDWPGNIREMENMVKNLALNLSVNPSLDLGTEIKRYWENLGLSVPVQTSASEVPPGLLAETTLLQKETAQVLELLALLEREGKAPGRSAVHRYCLAHGISLSEQQIKTRIFRLRELGFLVQGEGYGNIITSKGRAYLQRSIT